LSAREGEVFYNFELDEGNYLWTINEVAGTARRSDGLDIPGRIPFQSEMTVTLIESILETGNCGLPTLSESVDVHRIFIRNMLEHWKKTIDSNAMSLPVT
jgi:hypothetical protein